MDSLITFNGEIPLKLSEKSSEYLKVRAPASITSNPVTFSNIVFIAHSLEHLLIAR
jgi:hypothetical protein